MKKKGRARQTGCFEDHAFAVNGRCRACARVRARRYRERRADSIHARDRARKTTLRSRQDETAALARARAIVGVYVRRGKLVRPERCSECRSPHPLPYHQDPSRPLEVEWLCRSCRRYRCASAALEIAELEVSRAEEDAARQMAEANQLRQRGDALYRALDANERDALDAAHARGGRDAVVARVGAGNEGVALAEFLDRRANHARAREAMGRRMGFD